MNPKLQDALNAQIQAESSSAWLYLATADYAERLDLKRMGQR